MVSAGSNSLILLQEASNPEDNQTQFATNSSCRRVALALVETRHCITRPPNCGHTVAVSRGAVPAWRGDNEVNSSCFNCCQ